MVNRRVNFKTKIEMKNYQILQEALDKAVQKGAFNLQESGVIVQTLIAVRNDLQELEEYRKGAGAAKDLPDLPEPQVKPANPKKAK